MRLAAACLLALSLAACGGDDPPPADDAAPPPAAEPEGETPPETEAAPETDPGAPAEEPPVTEEGGPPPAWIEVPSGSQWMAYGSYCWDDVCFDVLQASCDDDAVPRLEVRPGDRVRFHLGFVPEQADLTVGGSENRPEVVELEPARVLEWEAGDRDGHLWLMLTAPEGGAAYQACLSRVL